MAGAAGDELTADERAVYDRQLRVWGVEAQRRLGQAKFFVAGLTGLSAEACKNVVLAGIGSVTLFDDGTSAQDAHPGNFLAHAGVADHKGASLTAAEATAATLREMNTFGTVTVAKASSAEAAGKEAKANESDFAGITEQMLAGVDVVLLGGASVAARERVGDLARAAGAKIFAGAVRGYAADFVADLGDAFEHVVETGSSETTKTTTKTVSFVPLRTALRSSWSDLGAGRDGGMRRVNRLAAAATMCAAFERNHGRPPVTKEDLDAMSAEIPSLETANGVKPGWMHSEALVEYAGGGVDGDDAMNVVVAESPAVAAIAGGVLAQEMLRAVTKVGEPVRNAFFFSAANGQGTVENLGWARREL